MANLDRLNYRLRPSMVMVVIISPRVPQQLPVPYRLTIEQACCWIRNRIERALLTLTMHRDILPVTLTHLHAMYTYSCAHTRTHSHHTLFTVTYTLFAFNVSIQNRHHSYTCIQSRSLTQRTYTLAYTYIIQSYYSKYTYKTNTPSNFPLT